MIYVTGDTHGDFRRFSSSAFPEQKGMGRGDHVIVCGDFGGVWKPRADRDERYWLDWLADKPFTLLWADGNHENFARLNGGEFERVPYAGGVARRIRENVYHVPRGQVLTLEGKRFFFFGGAASHDIADGVLDPAEHDPALFRRLCARWRRERRSFRVKGVSWWPEELPDAAELDAGRHALEACGFEVDYVISHCLPQRVVEALPLGGYAPDRLTLYFDDLLRRGLRFKRWYCGHYHTDRDAPGGFRILYERIVPLDPDPSTETRP